MTGSAEKRFQLFMRQKPDKRDPTFYSPTCIDAERIGFKALSYSQDNLDIQTGKVHDREGKVVAQYFEAPVIGIKKYVDNQNNSQVLPICVINPIGNLEGAWNIENPALVVVGGKALWAVLYEDGNKQQAWYVTRFVRGNLSGRTNYQEEAVALFSKHKALLEKGNMQQWIGGANPSIFVRSLSQRRAVGA